MGIAWVVVVFVLWLSVLLLLLAGMQLVRARVVVTAADCAPRATRAARSVTRAATVAAPPPAEGACVRVSIMEGCRLPIAEGAAQPRAALAAAVVTTVGAVVVAAVAVGAVPKAEAVNTVWVAHSSSSSSPPPSL